MPSLVRLRSLATSHLKRILNYNYKNVDEIVVLLRDFLRLAYFTIFLIFTSRFPSRNLSALHLEFEYVINIESL